MKANKTKKLSNYFSVVRDANGKIAEFTLNRKKYANDGKTIVPKADLDPVELSQMPGDLTLRIDDSDVYRIIHTERIQDTSGNSTKIECEYTHTERFWGNKPYLGAWAPFVLEQLVRQRAASSNDVEFLNRRMEDGLYTVSFIVTVQSKDFNGAFKKASDIGEGLVHEITLAIGEKLMSLSEN
ncbi:MAG: hypothetical protein ABI623_06150 [bacterium]